MFDNFTNEALADKPPLKQCSRCHKDIEYGESYFKIYVDSEPTKKENTGYVKGNDWYHEVEIGFVHTSHLVALQL